MIRVYNRHSKYPNSAIWVGRPTALGNPFTHLPGIAERFGLYLVQTRDEAVDYYDQWLCEHIAARTTDICRKLNDLWRIARDGELNLLCVCEPKRCHAHVIKRVLEERL